MNFKTIRLLQLIFSLSFLTGIVISSINLLNAYGPAGITGNTSSQIIFAVYGIGFLAIAFSYFNSDAGSVKHREVVKVGDTDTKSEDIVHENEQQTDYSHVSNEINKILKTESDNKSKIDRVLSALCNGYNAGQGVLFKLDKTGGQVKLKIHSTYAFVNNKDTQDGFYINDGLVGLAVKEDRDIEINDLPKDTIKIVSGLGKTAPGSIVIIPIKENQEMKGVVELSFFKPIDYKLKRILQEQIHKIGSLV